MSNHCFTCGLEWSTDSTACPECTILSDAATDAGSHCAWAITGYPSAPVRTARQQAALMVQLGRLAHYRDDAEASPAAFVRAYFDTIDATISDTADEIREDETFARSPEVAMGVAGQFKP